MYFLYRIMSSLQYNRRMFLLYLIIYKAYCNKTKNKIMKQALILKNPVFLGIFEGSVLSKVTLQFYFCGWGGTMLLKVPAGW